MKTHERTISHIESKKNLDEVKERISTIEDLPEEQKQQQLLWVDELASFGLGRFLLQHGGLNGYWTHYIVEHVLGSKELKENGLEAFLLEQAPTVLATRQRSQIFKSLIAEEIAPNKRWASIPGGVMGEFLTLGHSLEGMEITGIDLDASNFTYAQQLAERNGVRAKLQFEQRDAWSLEEENRYDLVSSNGLNIYVEEEDKLIELYRTFYKMLSHGGVFITSALTVPPIPGRESEWKMDQLNPQHMLMQKVLFQDILGSDWQQYRSTAETIEQLKAVGFTEVTVFFDQAHIFPTFRAKKAGD